MKKSITADYDYRLRLPQVCQGSNPQSCSACPWVADRSSLLNGGCLVVIIWKTLQWTIVG